MQKTLIFLTMFIQFVYCQELYYYQNNKKVTLAPIEKMKHKVTFNGDMKKIKYYKTEKQQIVGIGDEIIVKLKKDIKLSNILSQYPIVTIKKLRQELYLLRVDKDIDTLTIVNKLQQNSNVLYAHPNLIKSMYTR